MSASTDTPGATGTSGTAGTTTAAGAATTAGATGTTGAASEAPAASPSGSQTYRLIANGSALTPHVGKKLELTGTIEDQPAGASSSDAAASGPALRVTAGKVVANSCQ
jgi:hypothetical protein